MGDKCNVNHFRSWLLASSFVSFPRLSSFTEPMTYFLLYTVCKSLIFYFDFCYIVTTAGDLSISLPEKSFETSGDREFQDKQHDNFVNADS
jgi:hypothetical protein